MIAARRRGQAAVLLLAAGAVAASLLGCRQAPEEEVVLGLIVPLTHSPRLAGQVTLDGADLAVAEINAAGGVRLKTGRRPLRLIVEDNEDRPELAVSKAFKLVEADDAVAILGVPLSHNAIAVARVAATEKVPMISTFSTHPETTRDNPWAFRLAFLDTEQGRLMADFAFDDLAARSAGLLVDAGSPYSRSLGDAFAEAWRRRGGTVDASELYTRDQPDLGRQLAALRQGEPDVLFLPNYARFVPDQARQVRQAGIDAVLLGADAWTLVAADDRSGLAGSYYSDVWSPDLPNAETAGFVERYRAVHGVMPSSAAALAFDTVAVLATALEQAGEADRDRVRQALASLPEFQGITGRIRLQPDGNPRRSAVIKRITDQGKVVFFREVDP